MLLHISAVFATLIVMISAITVSYDPGYDNASRSLASVACSDGTNGLLTKGYTTQGSLPSFPNIGGAFAIAGYNSASCGSCYELSYNGNTVTVLAIDHTDAGFNIAETALNTLTGGQAVHLGRVDVNYTLVNGSACGL